jgi:hypothetical protein
MRVPLTLRRIGAHRLVLAAVLLTVLVAVALAAALAVFAWQAVPQAVHHELAVASDTSVLVSGPVAGSQAGMETAGVQAGMRDAFGTVPFTFYSASWSAPLALPGESGGPQGTARMQAASADSIQANAVLTAGAWPGAPAATGVPVPAALPAAAAVLLHLSPGDTFVLASGPGKTIRVLLTGTFRPRDPAAAYWQLSLLGASGFRSSQGATTYGPLVVDPAAFGKALTVSSASWLAVPDTSRIADGDLGPLASQLTEEQLLMLDSATLGNLTMTTNLPAVLGDLASNTVVAHSLLAICALQLLLIAGTALVLSARLLGGQRQGEFAQMSARGGSGWQLTQLNAVEAMPVAAVAVGGGALAGAQLAALLARTGPLRAASLRIPVSTAAAWWAAAATTVLCVAILLVSALNLRSPIQARARRGRQATVSGLALAGVDVALVALAAVAVWELRRYSAVTPSASGTLSVDPVLAMAPALALIGGTVILVRLLPAVARAGDRLARRGRRLATALAGWQISRRPVHQAGPALLLVLAVATGTLVLSQHQSWIRSARDQATFAAGADVRVDTPQPVSVAQAGDIATAAGVHAAMPAAPLGYGSTGQAVALDASAAPATVLLRPDLSSLPEATLFRRITPHGRALGLTLPGRAARVVIPASLGPAALRLGAVTVTMSIQDADGNVYALPAGTLSADGRTHDLTAVITPARQAVYPLRLIALAMRYQLPKVRVRGRAVLTVGADLTGWTPTVSSPDLAGLLATPGEVTGKFLLPSVGAWTAPAGPRGGQTLSFNPGYGQAAAPAGPIPAQVSLTASSTKTAPLPGIATAGYLSSAGVAKGAIVQITANGVQVPVVIVAEVTAFPTITGPGGAVIVDLGALQDYLTVNSAAPVPVTQWWLAAAPSPALTARLPPGSALTVPGTLAAGLLGDPLSAVSQQALLALAVAAALLALAGVCVSIASHMTERRAQSALLSALGVTRSAQARQLCLEELALSVPSAVTGLVLGAVLAWLLVPAVTLTTAAAPPVPSVITEYAWSNAVPLAAVVATLPVLVAAVAMVRQPDPATRLRAAEAP